MKHVDKKNLLDIVAEIELAEAHTGPTEQATIDRPVRQWFPLGLKTTSTYLDGYSEMIVDKLRHGFSCYMVTMVFDQFPGARSAIMGRIKDEVERVYRTLITRVVHRPRTAPTDELPVLIGALDLNVNKNDQSTIPLALCNEGLHFGAVIMIPPNSRLKVSLREHFEKKQQTYTGVKGGVLRIDVRELAGQTERQVVDYTLKTILNGHLSYDDAMMVLPRSKSEL